MTGRTPTASGSQLLWGKVPVGGVRGGTSAVFLKGGNATHLPLAAGAALATGAAMATPHLLG